LIGAISAAVLFGPAVAGTGSSSCCPGDLSDGGIVDGNDLAIVLGSWGPCEGCIADINDDGVVDGSDLAIVLGGWGPCPVCPVTTVIGSVIQADGAPVSDAVIVTDLGGQGVSIMDGTFSFEVNIPDGATTMHATAVAQIAGTTMMGTSGEVPVIVGGITNIGPITVLAETPTCEELEWLPTFGSWPPGLNNGAWALTVFDDGAGGGPALYAGGAFTTAGGAPANRVVRWNGSHWSPLGSGMTSSVYAMIVFDDGTGGGPALYAGGAFNTADGVSASNIARWNGSNWSPLGSGLNGPVRALTIFDDGSGAGPALYAGGAFDTAGGVSANGIARWNGSNWSPIGSGVNGTVYALTMFDDGSGGGPALYAGGSFTSAGGATANRIARWNGSSWSPLGSGVGGSLVRALTIFDDGFGGGPALYAGGRFTTAGGTAANRIARWNGSSWSAVGSGMDDEVDVLMVWDDGSGGGPALYAAGDFTIAGGAAASRIARWNGSTWSPLGSGANDSISALAIFDDGSGNGPALYAGGAFTIAGGGSAGRIGRWSRSNWSLLGVDIGLNNSIHAMIVFDDGSGSGPALHVGGSFTTADGSTANRVARWDGSSWFALGSGLNDTVHALAVFDDGFGGGPALYAAGAFSVSSGIVYRVARWNGTSWLPLGSGGGGMNATVLALAVFDDGLGGGPALYAGGEFTVAGGVPANRVARWNGSTWSPLGSGMNAAVHTLTEFDDGSGAGPSLYAGGNFWTAGGIDAIRVARWNGSSWSPLGSGMTSTVYVLNVFDDGSGGGPALYAGGVFSSAGGVTVNRIARWNGSSWSPLGSGVNKAVRALTVFDDGTGGGPALYVGGEFETAGGITSNFVARWNGSSWSPLGSGVTNWVRAISIFDDRSGGGPALYMGGDFVASPAGDSFIAKWGCPAPRDE